MLVLWARDEEDRKRVLDRLPDPRNVRPSGSWEGFRRRYPEAGCALVVAPGPEPELLARLQTLRRHHPEPSIVLMTRRDPSGLRRLKDVVVEEVVWTDAPEEELDAAVRRAEAERRFRRMEEMLMEAREISPTLAAALARALRRRPPLNSVQSLAGQVDRDRRTLWHHWRNVVGEETDLTLKGFLDWILLLRAVARKTGGRSWRQVAGELGIHTRTLRRVARRRLDRSLEEISGGNDEAFFLAFEREVMEPLLAGGWTGEERARA